MKTEEKSNKITAIPELLDLLMVKGSMIMIDAMESQKEIAKVIRNKKADYVLAVKKNQPTLYANIKDYFDTALTNKTGNFTAESVAEYDKDHDRIENVSSIIVKISAG